MTDRELLDLKGHEVNDDLPPLPEPFDYCYEWDGPFGTRKFSVSSYNGRGPDRSVPLYTADQLRAAVLAERGRCADIVMYELGETGQARAIADAIRKGAP